MNGKHTPGPWIYYADLPSAEPNWHIVTTANKMCVLANVHIEPGNAMDEANARLIAAAPDLLDALKRIIDHHGSYIYELPGPFGVGDLEAARKAISQAERCA